MSFYGLINRPQKALKRTTKNTEKDLATLFHTTPMMKVTDVQLSTASKYESLLRPVLKN
jgi:hypothetical protein